STPVVVDIFTKAPLAAYVGGTAHRSLADLQKAALVQQPKDVGILEFGREIWEAWSKKNLEIWKLSHGINDFSYEERQHYLNANLVAIYGGTRKSQGEAFQKAPVGTLFYLCHGNENLLLVGQFTSEPFPCSKGKGWLQRHYRVLKKAVKKGGYQGEKKGWTPNYRSTFMPVKAADLPDFESRLLKPYFNVYLAELAELSTTPFENIAPSTGSNPTSATPTSVMTTKQVSSPVNRIYYGPPGTGKTYTLTRLLKRDYEQAIQSVSAEEWQSQFVAENIAVLKWWEGAAAALYDLGGKAKVAQLEEHRFIQAIKQAKGRTQGIKQTLWGTLQHHTVDTSKTVNTKLRMAPAIFDKSVDSVWEFAGDWQDTCEDIFALVDQLKAGQPEVGAVERYSFVTFHQSYGYEEFVEGLRPVLNNDEEADAGEVRYEIRPGVFKELCRKARQAPDQRFAMVIDEINRGNISKIFGELITLIEADKRDPLDGKKPP